MIQKLWQWLFGTPETPEPEPEPVLHIRIWGEGYDRLQQLVTASRSESVEDCVRKCLSTYELLMTLADRRGQLHLADGQSVDLMCPRGPWAID